ncbi:hypothetical protein D7319_04230 [Streptomyces radicis]|uniref:Uncharacterized protein n=1 Tax=Streptomyces radicis TaxID=1750517 RepID=A0A3A9WH35_9ACTN|nr:hypothetical protein D7319_04230 [Streptomyces radicis]RKN25848.1 hypothetical protein D7318_06250 [Streptomyces radicis]
MLAREVFAALGGVMVVGAAAARGRVPFSAGAFSAARRGELDRLLAIVQELTGFGPETMALFDELGWHLADDAAPWLVMWSAAYHPLPTDAENPAAFRRMVGMGADHQAVRFLHALVSAALNGPQPMDRTARLLAEALRVACGLLPGTEPDLVFRIWRVAHLPTRLRPGPASPAEYGTRLRACAHALEAALFQDG